MSRFARLKNRLLQPAGATAPFWPFLVCLGCFGILFVRFPGEWDSDTVQQHAEMLSGMYTDWHPPVMSAFWGLVNRLWNTATGMQITGSGVLFTLHAVAFWSGLAMILRRSRPFWNELRDKPLKVALLPLTALLFLGLFELVPMCRFVFKDTGMIAAYTLATGILCVFPRSLPCRVMAGVACLALLFYGTALRHNSLFALLPLLFLLLLRCSGSRRFLPLLAGTLLLWGGMLATIHFVNYTALSAQRTFSIQEIFYRDIWQLNFHTKRFELPPPVRGKGWEPLTEETFRDYYSDVPYILKSFDHINRALPEPVDVYRDFRGVPEDLTALRNAWFKRVRQDCGTFISLHRKQFTALLTRFSFMGCNGVWYLFLSLGIAVPLLWRMPRMLREHQECTPQLLAASALLYVLPYLLALPDTQRRYLHWFYLASCIAIVWVAGSSPLIRELCARTADACVLGRKKSPLP